MEGLNEEKEEVSKREDVGVGRGGRGSEWGAGRRAFFWTKGDRGLGRIGSLGGRCG